MNAWWVDSLEHVFHDAAPAEAPDWTIRGARNEVISLQLVVRSARGRRGVIVTPAPLRGAEGEIPPPRWRAVGYVPVKRNTPHTPPEELVRAAPGWFPDPLLELGSLSLEPDRAQPVWLTLHVPPDAPAGAYEGTVALADGDDRVELRFRLEVAAAAVPEQRSLRITNWFWLDERVYRHFGVTEMYRESWWRMVERFVHNMWAHRQNQFWLRPFEWVCEYSARGGQLVIDFSRFDRWCQILRGLGGPFWLEGPFLTARDGYDGAFEVPVPVVAGSRVEVRRLRCDDPRVEPFVCQFLREYEQRVRANAMEGRVSVHVGDEPHGPQMQDYARIASLVHQYAPSIPILEALDVSSDYEFFDQHTDIWVPLLGRYDAHVDIIRRRRAEGKQVWHYTCLFPRGKHPNRFVDYPLLKTRLLHWINYRWDLGGYLHWGWNAWTPNPYQDLEPEWGGGTTLPAGDAFLVYPGTHSVFDSIRYEQMLEGIQDYELLAMLGQKRPELAQEIAREVVPSFTDYLREPAPFRAARARLLQELAG